MDGLDGKDGEPGGQGKDGSFPLPPKLSIEQVVMKFDFLIRQILFIEIVTYKYLSITGVTCVVKECQVFCIYNYEGLHVFKIKVRAECQAQKANEDRVKNSLQK